MTLTELCDVLRKRRERTGLTWALDEHRMLREQSVQECCPLTAAILEKTGEFYDTDDAAQGAAVIGAKAGLINSVICAADGDIYYDPDEPTQLAEIRAALLEACGVEEPCNS